MEIGDNNITVLMLLLLMSNVITSAEKVMFSSPSVCLSVCLRMCAKYLKKYKRVLMKFVERWVWSREESIECWWRSGFFRGSCIIFQDFLSLADRAKLAFCSVSQQVRTDFDEIFGEWRLAQGPVD